MSIKLICLGKTKQDFIKKGVQEYQKRLRVFGALKIKVLPDEKLTSKKVVEEVKQREAATLLKEIEASDYVIALDENGKQFSSVQFAHFLKQKLNYKNLVFLIGGTYGLAEEVLTRADLVLGFSRFTFTHQMIRLIFMEQLYRAYTIINSKKYHY
jgi:23S rRNA (pseudouridine1915-N3)-methyltransferase